MKDIKEHILKESYSLISEDTRLIKLATFTTIFHSLIFTLYIIYQILFFISKLYKNPETDSLFHAIINYSKEIVKSDYFRIVWIPIAILLIIWYFLLPPIAESSLIYYLEKKDIWYSLKNWIKKFFIMFELHWLLSVFNFLIFIITISRLYIMDILFNPIIIFILVIWLLIILWTTFFLPYTKFIICLENQDLKPAIKKSIKLALDNLWITLKFVIVNYLLYIRFVINILIIIFLPLWIIWLISIFVKNLQNSNIFKFFFWGSALLAILIVTYINGIIEAFFISYWYKVYKILETNKSE